MIEPETVAFTGGLWLLWNSDRVQVTQLAMSEQEYHVLVKVLFSNFEFICMLCMLVLNFMKDAFYGII